MSDLNYSTVRSKYCKYLEREYKTQFEMYKGDIAAFETYEEVFNWLGSLVPTGVQGDDNSMRFTSDELKMVGEMNTAVLNKMKDQVNEGEHLCGRTKPEAIVNDLYLEMVEELEHLRDNIPSR